MEQFFTTLLGMSATASWAILAILLLRFFLRKASCQFLRALWAIPALRLLLPFSMQSNASAFQVLPGADAVFGILFQPPSSLSQSSAASSSVGGAPSPIFIASILYLCGACLLLLYGLISFLCLKSRVSSATLLRENIYQSEAVSSPFLLGLFHPRIYLPYHMAPGQMEDVLAHEQEHIAAHDHIWKPFAFLLLCAYWFSPAVWAAYLLFCRDIEFACDERVIRRLIPAQRKKYAQTLLDLAAQEKKPAICPVAFGWGNIKSRIRQALLYRKPAWWCVLGAVLLCAILAFAFLTDAPFRSQSEHAQISILLQGEQPVYRASYRSSQVSSISETDGPPYPTGQSIILNVREEGPTNYTIAVYGEDDTLLAKASFSDVLVPGEQLHFLYSNGALVRRGEPSTP